MLDPKGLEAAELELSEVLKDWHYVMPTDGMDRVISAYLSASIPADVEGLATSLEESATGHGNTEGSLRQRAASALRSQAQRIGELERALGQCAAYIQSPIRMSRDEDETARRAGIVQRARAALAKEGNGNV